MTCAVCPNVLPPRSKHGPPRRYCSNACRQRASHTNSHAVGDDYEVAPPDDLSWRDAAACLDADPSLFFVELGGSGARAKAICAECPVTDECLDYALAMNVPYGIWAGLNEKERRAVKRKRRAMA